MSKLIDRIQKLQAKADGTDNPEEAALFAGKVQALLAEHNLSSDVLDAEDPEETTSDTWDAKYINPWRNIVTQQVSKLYFCEMMVEHSRYIDKNGFLATDRVYRFYGKPHNVAISISMSQYLIGTTLRLAKRYSRVRHEQLAFERGCGQELGNRLYHMRQKLTKPKDGDGSGLPALYNTELELAKAKMEEDHPDLTSRPHRNETDSDSSDAGRAQAHSISLNQQVDSGKGPALLK